MAEKYGIVPKRFSKEWWPYFWDYYKWHTIGILFAIFIIVFTTVEIITRERYDFAVTYAGYKIYTEEHMNEVGESLSQYADDVDGNGEKSIIFQQLNFSDNPANAEYDYTMQTKLDMQLQDKDRYLFLFDGRTAGTMLEREYSREAFMAVSEWTHLEVDEAKLLRDQNGEAIAVNVKDKEMLRYNDDLYVFIKKNFKPDDETASLAHQSSVNIANELIKND